MKKTNLLMTLLLVSAAMLFAGGSQEEKTGAADTGKEPVTLNWLFWYPEPTQLIETYESLNPNVSIVYEQVGGNNYAKVLNTRIMAEEIPDLFVPYYVETYYQMIEEGKILDLTDYPFMDSIDESAVALNSVDGRIYNFPLEASVICTFYNKELFEKYDVDLPTNYDEFLEVCEIFKSNGVAPLVQGMADLWQCKYAAGFNQLSAVLYNDSEWLNKLKEGKVEWTDPIMQKQYDKKEAFIKAGYMHEDSLSLNFDQAWSVFCTGEAAMMGAGTFLLNNVYGKTQPDFEWDVTFTFVNDKGQPQKTEYYAQNSMLCINSDSKNKEEALRFVEWLASPGGQGIFAKTNQAFTTSKNADYSFHPEAIKFKKLYDHPEKFYFLREPAYLATEFGKTIQDLFLGLKSAEEITEELQKKTDASIQ